jgi:hypothetical protein
LTNPVDFINFVFTKTELECPVDFVAINENKARLTAFFVFALVIIFIFTKLWIIPAFLIVDFSIRASMWGKYSLLGILSDAIIKQAGIKYKATDRAPKRFAALVGVIFSIPILVLTLFNTIKCCSAGTGTDLYACTFRISRIIFGFLCRLLCLYYSKKGIQNIENQCIKSINIFFENKFY